MARSGHHLSGTVTNLAGPMEATITRKRTVWSPKIVDYPPLYQGVFVLRCEEGGLCTRNLIPGKAALKGRYNGYIVYVRDADEIIIEYRPWDAFRSPLAAAIADNKPDDIFIRPGCRVLYLGDGKGALATVSHISDIVGTSGAVYEVESGPKNVVEMVNMAARRANVTPILEDARDPEKYRTAIDEKVDVVYCDIAEDDQVTILLENVKFYLKDGGNFLLKYEANSSWEDRGAELYSVLKNERLYATEDVCLDPYFLNTGLLFGVYTVASSIESLRYGLP
ncbi:unnamed protein product [Cuscuta epithymum]|uniref:rRNA 2'-O-methyltransferase fibrillarin n=1 Tax=Cuscuta epithymum TaxID=186058 RepID=A0AAV0EID9_9ASTE|nr:unnamed protein product [Cuscuta epithymum]